nr:hypothetical transcript [Hymenolepis microstoma]
MDQESFHEHSPFYFQVVLFHTDCRLMTDIANSCNYFYRFKPFQFLGLAPEPMQMTYDLGRFGGMRHISNYNDGLLMWYLQRLTMEKWDKIWQSPSTYHRALKMPRLVRGPEEV